MTSKHVGAGGARKRGRFGARRLLAAAVAVWTVAAIAIPLSSSLPSALRTSGSVRRLHDQLTLLGSGWTGAIDLSAATRGSGPGAWEWSIGHSSTIHIPEAWGGVALELFPAACPGGRRQRVIFGGPASSARKVLVLHSGFHWYDIRLGFLHGGRPLRLTYGCVVQPRGVLHPEEVAVAVAGLQVGRP